MGPVKGESPAWLLKADERVLFFLGRDRRPLTGNATNAYTLDRFSSRSGATHTGIDRRRSSMLSFVGRFL